MELYDYGSGVIFSHPLKNSKYCLTHINNDLHTTNWNIDLGCNCQKTNVVDACGCSPIGKQKIISQYVNSNHAFLGQSKFTKVIF